MKWRFEWVKKYLQPKGSRALMVFGCQLALLFVIAFIVYTSGGTKNARPHLAYLPIILAAFSFGIPGGLVSGMVAGLVLGPWMPMDVELAIYQQQSSWLFRLFFFMTIGGVAGLLFEVLGNTIEQLVEAEASMLRALSTTVSLRNKDTGNHSERVAYNALLVGKAMGLALADLQGLYWAAILHDLGKIATPEEILVKPGKLTPEEYSVIKQHPQIGADLLRSISDDFEPVIQGVLAHHERWDGMGYPYGQQGEEIHIFGRVLAVVDVFEALTSKRPYRGPLLPEDAVNYICENRGSHFDPGIVDVFMDLYNQGKILIHGRPPDIEVAPPVSAKRVLLSGKRYIFTD